MPHNLDIGLLRAFVAVAESGSMTRAAAVLNLTQGAVSQQVKRLETLFDTRLFARQRGGLRLSAAGERLMPRALKLLELNDAVWNMMAAPEMEGELRLGVPHDIIAPYVPPILKSFSREWPRVQVFIMSDTTPRLLAMMETGEIDMTLTTERTPADRAEILASEPLVWAGAPGGTAHTRRPLPLALGSVDCAFRSPTLDAVAAAGLEWSAICSESEMATLTAIAAADIGIVPLLRSSVPDSLEVLGPDNGLPALPRFKIALYPPLVRATVSDVLADHIRRAFAVQLSP